MGNYGNAWWEQQKEFDTFNGPILLTTNCIVPVRDSYKDRIYTTGRVAYPGVTHIPDRKNGSPKDFSAIIEKARGCKPPTELESGEITGGFAHNQVLALADKVVAAVKTGAIKRFVVMAGCDGRRGAHYTEVAENLPKDTIIRTAGCAVPLQQADLGDIGGIPALDAGQQRPYSPWWRLPGRLRADSTSCRFHSTSPGTSRRPHRTAGPAPGCEGDPPRPDPPAFSPNVARPWSTTSHQAH